LVSLDLMNNTGSTPLETLGLRARSACATNRACSGGGGAGHVGPRGAPRRARGAGGRRAPPAHTRRRRAGRRRRRRLPRPRSAAAARGAGGRRRRCHRGHPPRPWHRRCRGCLHCCSRGPRGRGRGRGRFLRHTGSPAATSGRSGRSGRCGAWRGQSLQADAFDPGHRPASSSSAAAPRRRGGGRRRFRRRVLQLLLFAPGTRDTGHGTR